jgi:hypothetical protein
VAAARATWQAQQPEIAIERLVFIDETGGLNQDGAPLRPVRARPALRCTRSAWPLAGVAFADDGAGGDVEQGSLQPQPATTQPCFTFSALRRFQKIDSRSAPALALGVALNYVQDLPRLVGDLGANGAERALSSGTPEFVPIKAISDVGKRI